MPRVRISPKAEQDLDGIADYIALNNEAASDRFLQEIKQKSNLYAAHPGLGRRRPELGNDIRSFPHGAYIVYFSPESDGIMIRRVLHSARDISEEFSK